VLRHVSPAFAEDPLRVLRVARFAARYHHLGFRIAEETLELMREIVASGEIEHLVAERVWKETARALAEPNPEVFFQVLHSCGALTCLFAELAARATPATWSALMRSAQQNLAAPVRFAVLCAELHDSATDALCERLKAPGQFRELALLVVTQHRQLAAVNSPEQALALLEQADAVRRPERFEQFLTACAVLLVPARQIQRIREALQAVATVAPRLLLVRGFSGKALGEQLQRERLTAIQELWS
jgi:tRNA nucleotidyltransferase (CCA-adding enzyme)